MSPSPTSRVGESMAIGLCSDAVGIVRLGGWRRTRVDGQEQVSVADPTTDGLAAVAALDRWLQQHPSPVSGLRRWRRAPAYVVLSDRLLRYALVPWAGGSLSRQEETALTHACFEERYGDMSGWTLRSDLGKYGQGRLAAAVPTALIEALQAVLQQHHLACNGMTPYFTACWNRWRRDIAQANGQAAAMFAVFDAGTVVIGVMDGAEGGWRSLRSLRAATDAAEVLPLLARETLLLGLPEQPAIWVHSRQSGVFDSVSGNNLHVLSTAASLPAPIAMAMRGIGQ